LFGCKITDESVTAELSFFAANISTAKIDLFNGTEKITIELPECILNQNMPCKLHPYAVFKKIAKSL
jgi:hypothetical protein